VTNQEATAAAKGGVETLVRSEVATYGAQYPLGAIQPAEQAGDVIAFLLGDGVSRLTSQIIVMVGGFASGRPLVR